MYQNRTLVRADNLEEMQKFPDECIDLIATDPPFNSKRDYFVPFRDEHGREPDALVKAFSDTWTWGSTAEETCHNLIVNVGGQVGATIQGLQQFLDETPMMTYLVMMAARIVEMHRILKSTGSLYLHCDPTASHYLKIILDAIFDTKNFRNEIIWHYQTGGVSKRWFGRKHDVILFYSKTNKYSIDLTRVKESRTPEVIRRIETGNENATRATDLERLPFDVWNIQALNAMDNERTGYPTQKPIDLYTRIIKASSNKGNLVLDPFCGCGTTLMAAEKLEREWIGIDLTYLATGAVKLQIEKLFPQLRNEIIVTGTPENEEQALELARTNHKGFEEWSVTHVLKFKSNANKVADGGVDGTFVFPLGRIRGKQEYGKAVAQIKGGGYALGDVRDFRTAMQNANADLGVFVVTKPPTSGMLTEAARAGTYNHPSYEFSADALQIYQIQDYFRDKLPQLPHAERVVL